MDFRLATTLGILAGPRGRRRVVRALAAELAGRRAGRIADRARGRVAAGARADPERRRHHGRRASHRLRAGRPAGVHGRRAGGADLEHLARAGAVDGLADGGLGPGGPRGRRARDGSPGGSSGASGWRSPAGRWASLYGALLDLSVMVTYGGEQSLDRYLALSARGIPFNLAHAAGNFAIAFAAGPALVRMISRFRERLEFTWHPAGALPVALAALVVALGSVGRARRARRRRRAAARGSSAPRTPTVASRRRPASPRRRR